MSKRRISNAEKRLAALAGDADDGGPSEWTAVLRELGQEAPTALRDELRALAAAIDTSGDVDGVLDSATSGVLHYIATAAAEAAGEPLPPSVPRSLRKVGEGCR